MNDPETTRAMVGAVDEPKKVAEGEVSENSAEATDELARQREGCIKTLCAIVDQHTDKTSTLPPRASRISDRGHGIWRERAYQLRGLHAYYTRLMRNEPLEASEIETSRAGEPGT